jgi:hypothetical protein
MYSYGSGRTSSKPLLIGGCCGWQRRQDAAAPRMAWLRYCQGRSDSPKSPGLDLQRMCPDGGVRLRALSAIIARPTNWPTDHPSGVTPRALEVRLHPRRGPRSRPRHVPNACFRNGAGSLISDRTTGRGRRDRLRRQSHSRAFVAVKRRPPRRDISGVHTVLIPRPADPRPAKACSPASTNVGTTTLADDGAPGCT